MALELWKRNRMLSLIAVHAFTRPNDTQRMAMIWRAHMLGRARTLAPGEISKSLSLLIRKLSLPTLIFWITPIALKSRLFLARDSLQTSLHMNANQTSHVLRGVETQTRHHRLCSRLSMLISRKVLSYRVPLVIKVIRMLRKRFISNLTKNRIGKKQSYNWRHMGHPWRLE